MNDAELSKYADSDEQIAALRDRVRELEAALADVGIAYHKAGGGPHELHKRILDALEDIGTQEAMEERSLGMARQRMLNAARKLRGEGDVS